MKNDTISNPSYANVDEYKMLSFDDRVTHGLRMDQSFSNHDLIDDLISMQSSDIRDIQKASVDMCYRPIRRMNSWSLKKMVNSILVDNKTVSKRMIELSRPILLDILMPVKPTIKDWTNLSEIDVGKNLSVKKSNTKTSLRSTGRIRDDFPHIVDHSPYPTLILTDQKSKTVDVYPKRPIRKDQRNDDKRHKQLTTAYSTLPIRGDFDLKPICDENYQIRLQNYWKGMIILLDEIQEKYNPFLKDTSWFVYHIINCDIGLQVLFDNISLECEIKWLSTLNMTNQMQIINPSPFSNPTVHTKNDVKNGINKIREFIKKFDSYEMSPVLKQHKIPHSIMKDRMLDLILESSTSYYQSNNEQISAWIDAEVYDHF